MEFHIPVIKWYHRIPTRYPRDITEYPPDIHLISQNTHQISTFSEHGSLRMTSGAIQATVPANDIFVLCSFHSRLVPKSDILITSSFEIRTLWSRMFVHISGQNWEINDGEKHHRWTNLCQGWTHDLNTTLYNNWDDNLICLLSYFS